MARRQVLVQLNDALLAQLDEAMLRTGASRSHLVRAAIIDYLERVLGDDVDRQYAEAYGRIPDTDELHALNTAVVTEMIRSEPW